jgi:hypothetical protein
MQQKTKKKIKLGLEYFLDMKEKQKKHELGLKSKKESSPSSNCCNHFQATIGTKNSLANS